MNKETDPRRQAARPGRRQHPFPGTRSLTHWHALRRWLLLLFLWVRRNVWKLVLFSAVGIYLHSRLPSLTAGAPWAVPLTSAFLVLGAFSLLLLLTSRSLVRLLLVSDRETRSALSHLERRAALLSLPAVLMMLTLCGMWLYAGVHLGSLIRMPMNAFLWAGLTKLIHETFASESDWVRRKMGWIALVCAAGLSVSTTVTFMQSVRFSWDLQQLVQNGEPLDEKQLSERVRELVFLPLRRGEDLPPGVQSAYGVTAPARRMVSRFEFLIVVMCAFADSIRSILERRAPDLR